MIKPLAFALMSIVVISGCTGDGSKTTGSVIASGGTKDCGTITISDPSQAYSVDQSKMRCFAERFAKCNPAKLSISVSVSGLPNAPSDFSYNSLQELSVLGWENNKCKYVQKVIGGGRTMTSTCLWPESALRGDTSELESMIRNNPSGFCTTSIN